MKNFQLLFCSLTLTLFAASAWAFGSESLTSNPVYEKNCAKCHGKTAGGRHFGGPALASDKVASASTDDLHNIISNGKGRMPKYAGKLNPDEIDALVMQIEAMNKK